MRLFTLTCLGLMALAGCCSHDSATSSEAEPQSTAKECTTGDCCSTISRSEILKRHSESEKSE